MDEQQTQAASFQKCGDRTSQVQTNKINGGESAARDSDDTERFEKSDHNPVDTGWSWVILSSVFTSMFLNAGILRSFGVLLVAVQNNFQTSASMVAALGGIASAVFSVSAFIGMSVLLVLMSIKQSVLIGGLVGTLGLVASFFATSVTYLTISFAFCIGIGMGLSYSPCFVLLNNYFKRKLPLATAVATSGGSLGGVVLPLVSSIFVHEYFLSGAFLLLGGLYAQILVAGSLLTPPSDYKPRQDHVCSNRLPNAEKKAQTSQSQLLLAAAPSRHDVNGFIDAPKNTHDNVKKTHHAYLIADSKPVTKSLQTLGDEHHCNQQLKHTSRDKSTSMPLLEQVLTASSIGSFWTVNLSRARSTSSQDKEEERGEHRDDLEDIDVISNEKSHEFCSNCVVMCQKMSDTFDSVLYQSVVFWLLTLYHCTACLVSAMPAAYLPFLAQEQSLTATQGALLVTISGILDILSRFVSGLLVQVKLVRPRTSAIVSMLVLGFVFQLTGFVEGMVALTLFSVIYGSFAGVFFSMMSLIILEFSDLVKFRKVFGFAQLAIGVSGVAGYFIAGCLRDVNGSYIPAFHFMGACGLLSALLLLAMPVMQRWEGSVTVEQISKEAEHA